MTDSKVFSSEYSSIQGQSDLDIIVRYHFDTPELCGTFESKDRCIAHWQKVVTDNPSKVAELAKQVREYYIERLKPEAKVEQDDMSAEIISL